MKTRQQYEHERKDQSSSVQHNVSAETIHGAMNKAMSKSSSSWTGSAPGDGEDRCLERW